MKKHYIISLVVVLACLLFALPVYAYEKPYTIDVNLQQNIVTVYSQDDLGEYTIPEETFVCSVGTETPTGTFYTSSKYEWRPLFGNVYGQYATRITGSILFHSVPYLKQDKSTLEWWEYNKLGTSASMGCVRLTVEDVKWIYDNCPIGTQVNMYYSSDAEPLVPEPPVVISSNDPNRGWDPTDSDANNPWLSEAVSSGSLDVEDEEEIISTTMPILSFSKDVSVFHKGDFYGLSATNTKLIWGLLGIPLLLPSNVDGEDVFGEISIYHNTITNTISYYRNDNIVYFSVLDIVEFTDISFEMDNTLRFIKDNGKTITLTPRDL